MPELRFLAVRGQLGVMRDGCPSVWFDCPAEDAFQTSVNTEKAPAATRA